MGRMRAKRKELAEALEGRFEGHHAELARILLDQIDALTRQTGQLSARVSELIAQIPAAQGIDADGTTGPGAGLGPDAAVLPAVARLDEITGCGIIAAQAVIAETGLDMTVFGTPGRLVSWAKRCPQTRQSGKKSTVGSAGKGNPWLNGILGEIAASASRTSTFLGERYRRLARRRGKRKALAAVARSVLVIIFHLLADPAARFRDLGPDYIAVVQGPRGMPAKVLYFRSGNRAAGVPANVSVVHLLAGVIVATRSPPPAELRRSPAACWVAACQRPPG